MKHTNSIQNYCQNKLGYQQICGSEMYYITNTSVYIWTTFSKLIVNCIFFSVLNICILKMCI